MSPEIIAQARKVQEMRQSLKEGRVVEGGQLYRISDYPLFKEWIDDELKKLGEMVLKQIGE